MEKKQLRKRSEKKLIEENAFLSEDPESGEKRVKRKLKLYPIPEEDSFMPIQDDSEEIIYKTKKCIS